MRATNSVNILGVRVSAIAMPDALNRISEWVHRKEPHYVCVTGVHGIMESYRDADLRRIHNQAGLVTPDGMPLVWLSRWWGHRNVSRVYGPDLLLTACKAFTKKGCRHFFYGGSGGVADALASRLRDLIPDLAVAGTYCPPFRDLSQLEIEDIRSRINQSRADIVWVGISTPRQERWMASQLGRINAPVLIGVGAAFDFLAGVKRQAPPWLQRSGLEWLFRLASEPRRLWKRYLRNNPAFVALVLMQCMGIGRCQSQ